jgi:hypothetical protein
MKELMVFLTIVALIAIGPLLLIWALNQLFSLGILYTFWNWLAALIIASTIKTKFQK